VIFFTKSSGQPDIGLKISGISGRKWILAARSTCNTLVASFAGCVLAIFYSLYVTGGVVDILMVINGILGSLVGVTGVTPEGSFLRKG
jgi:ammonia channel protein AmtB